MLPSLCPAMSAIPSVSRDPGRRGPGSPPIELAHLPLAGSIGCGIMARLYSERPLRGDDRAAGDCRRAPGGWRSCR